MNKERIEIENILQKLQYGYGKRDLDKLIDYLDMFHPALECDILGTGYNERFFGMKGAKKLLQTDWESWGEVDFNFKEAKINFYETCASVTSQGTVTQHLDPDKLHSAAIDSVLPDIMVDDTIPSKIKLFEILRYSATNLLETEKGTPFTWVLRFSAMLVKYQGRWRFVQMHFSHPNMIFPQIRLHVPRFLK